MRRSVTFAVSGGRARRIRSIGGFTLTEMLVTVFILTLASTLMATGIPAAIDTYQKVVKTSNAQMSVSTTVSVLRDEIGLATDVREAEDVGRRAENRIYYYSSAEGCWAYIGPSPNQDSDGNFSADPDGSIKYRGLIKQYLKGMPTPTNPPEALEPFGEPAPLISNETITNELVVVLDSATIANGYVEVRIHAQDLAGNHLAEVGDEVPYRVLTRFAVQD